MFLLCPDEVMTDRPANWRMPTPKQMEKLANASVVRGNVPPVRTPGPGDEMPPEYWQAILDDASADRVTPGLRSGRSGWPTFSGIYCVSPAGAADSSADSQALMNTNGRSSPARAVKVSLRWHAG